MKDSQPESPLSHQVEDTCSRDQTHKVASQATQPVDDLREPSPREYAHQILAGVIYYAICITLTFALFKVADLFGWL